MCSILKKKLMQFCYIRRRSTLDIYKSVKGNKRYFRKPHNKTYENVCIKVNSSNNEKVLISTQV